ncbi:MAG: hypothetical protein J6M39_06520 [Lachnospiraceae bacterium]|nr:hypothetical protein [Lachnospiraceae bacterium]
MKTLEETAALMNSADYKERFAAEYYQLETRYLKLKAMTEKWDKGELNFTPTCPRAIYDRQLSCMLLYLLVLLERSELEQVKLDIDDHMGKIFVLHEENQITMSKQVRIDIDDILRRVNNMEVSRETNLVTTKLQEAIMWMGMNLKQLGNPNPYPNSRNTNNTKVDKTADGLHF